MVLHDPKQSTSPHPLAWFPCTYLKKLEPTEMDSRIAVCVIFISGSGAGAQDKKLTLEHWCCCCWGFLLFFPPQSSFCTLLRICILFLLFHCLHIVTHANHMVTHANRSLSFLLSQLSLKWATILHGMVMKMKKYALVGETFSGEIWFHL